LFAFSSQIVGLLIKSASAYVNFSNFSTHEKREPFPERGLPALRKGFFERRNIMEFETPFSGMVTGRAC